VGEAKDKPRDEDWARRTLIELATASLREQRRARRWGIFFKLLILVYLGVLLWYGQGGQWPLQRDVAHREHVALVGLKGLIADGGDADPDVIVELLEQAFGDDKARGVILEINSPGGTPAQAARIHRAIQRLRQQHPDRKLYAVVEDLCASGAYWVAVAADEIWADPTSIVGSIGVRLDAFGVQKLLDKLGIENRTLAAGENKLLLDPFSPQTPAQRAHLQHLLDQTHQQFIEVVKAGRGDRLKPTPEMFSGLIWTGRDALRLGLIDGLGDRRQVAKEKLGVEDILEYEPPKTLLDQLTEGVSTAVARLLLRLGLTAA